MGQRQCNYIVLDEADRMMDMGFEEQVVTILDAMPASNLRPEDDSLAESDRIYRTTFMFSATMPPTVERTLASSLLFLTAMEKFVLSVLIGF